MSNIDIAGTFSAARSAASSTAPLPAALIHPENRPEFAGQDLGPLLSRIMIVDDEPINVKVARKYLQGAGYKNFITVTDATRCMDTLRQEDPDLVLLDVMMPQVNGLQILERIRADDRFKHLPVLILTASNDNDTKNAALQLGATDFLSKPIDPSDLLPRVRNVLIVKAHQDHLEDYSQKLEHQVQLRTTELELSRLRVFQCLARAGEFRDQATGWHVLRVGKCAAILAAELGYDSRQTGMIELAAQLHDVGKIGIPDGILHKPGKLTTEEFAVMKKHCEFGKAIIAPSTENEAEIARKYVELGLDATHYTESPLLVLSGLIAMTHHERFDGSGYPRGLKGEVIPLEGRITAIVDTFDALKSARPYKEGFKQEQCLEIIAKDRGTHFDPAVHDAFLKRMDDLLIIHAAHAE